MKYDVGPNFLKKLQMKIVQQFGLIVKLRASVFIVSSSFLPKMISRSGLKK